MFYHEPVVSYDSYKFPTFFTFKIQSARTGLTIFSSVTLVLSKALLKHSSPLSNVKRKAGSPRSIWTVYAFLVVPQKLLAFGF